MFFFEIAIGVFSYVLAKSIWNYVKVRATACNEYPIVWLAKFCLLVGLLVTLVTVLVAALGFAVWVIVNYTR